MMLKWLAVLCGVAFAVVAAATSAKATDWTGFYAGVQGGYANFTGIGPVQNQPVETTHWDGGIFAGVNATIGPFILGPDISVLLGSTEGSTQYDYTVSHVTYVNTDTISRGPLLLAAARAGVPLGSFLLYVSGGLAAAEVNFHRFSPPPANYDFGGSAMHVGYTLGAGIDMMVADNLMVGIDFRHVDLGTLEHQFSNSGRGDISASEQRILLRLGVKFP